MSLDINPAYPALILRATGDAIHHGALGVARTLGRLGAPVYAVVPASHTPLAASRYLRKAFIWKEWPKERASFLAGMSEVGESIGRPAVLFPMDDLSAIYTAENAAELAQHFVLPKVDPTIPRELADKIRLNAACSSMGIPVARNYVPQSMDDVVAFAETSKFPVVVKAAQQWTPLNGTLSTKIVSGPKELIALFKGLESVESPPSILQEYIEGEDWISHGYSNSEKGLYLVFTGRKLLGYPAAAGSTAVGLSAPNQTLRCLTEKLLKSFKYSGIVDTDWKKDKRDGQYKILDCNPRVGQNFRMFSNSAGIDVVRAQYLDLTGQSIENAPVDAGRVFTVESFCFLAILRGSYHPASAEVEGDSRRWRRELAWWTREDPLPFFVMCIRLPASLFRRSYLRVARRLFFIWRRVWRTAPEN